MPALFLSELKQIVITGELCSPLHTDHMVIKHRATIGRPNFYSLLRFLTLSLRTSFPVTSVLPRL